MFTFGLEIKGTPKQETSDKVDGLLGKLQLLDFRDRFPKDLSGGMKQRVAIARVPALDPPIMQMDEPFGVLPGHDQAVTWHRPGKPQRICSL